MFEDWFAGRSMELLRAPRTRFEADAQFPREFGSPAAVWAGACFLWAAGIAPIASQVGQIAAAPVVIAGKSSGRCAIGISSIHSPLNCKEKQEPVLLSCECLLGADAMSGTIYILNGPNLNLLGTREPHIYGHETLADVEADCRRVAAESGLSIEFRQSNAEFQLIDWIHEAREGAAIIINPGAFTHTSIAIMDALNACKCPILEVHISNVHRREAFRHRSYVSLTATAVMAGLGTHGYQLAVRHVAHLLKNKKG
jgi:3-dehydroquinate dehydratase II